ncbi:MAG: glycosyltransferase family 4 protein [Candidatus Dormibacteria bacterium]
MPITSIPARPLTVAMVAPPWYPLPPHGYGGIELVVSLLARGLRGRGHRVLLLGAEDSHDAVVGLAPVDWRTDLGNVHNQGLRDVTYAARVHRYLSEHGPVDVIHDHSGLSVVAGAQGRHLAPVVHTVHGPVTEVLASAIQSLGTSTSLVAISHSQMQPAPWLPWVGVVPNAVDVDALNFLPREDREPYLLVLARICPDKGQHHAIEVASRAGMRLVLAGKVDPGHENYFEEEIAPHLDGKWVTWHQNVAGADKARLLTRATALLAPITWPEPFGLSMVEAMVSGTPTIAFRQGSAPELIDEGKTGFVVDTIDEMVEAVGAIATIDPARCSLLARNRFSPDTMVSDYLGVYERVLASVRHPEEHIAYVSA